MRARVKRILLNSVGLLDSNSREKLFIIFFMVLIAMSFILHIPKMVETWNNTKINEYICHNNELNYPLS